MVCLQIVIGEKSALLHVTEKVTGFRKKNKEKATGFRFYQLNRHPALE